MYKVRRKGRWIENKSRPPKETNNYAKGQDTRTNENIFPIIKKFLYSEHEIFLRELISNATDASQKLKTLASIGEAKGELGDLRIDVTIDAKEKPWPLAITALAWPLRK